VHLVSESIAHLSATDHSRRCLGRSQGLRSKADATFLEHLSQESSGASGRQSSATTYPLVLLGGFPEAISRDKRAPAAGLVEVLSHVGADAAICGISLT